MELKLNKQELDYLTMIIEQNMEDWESKNYLDNKQILYKEMLEDLYSKLVILNK